MASSSSSSSSSSSRTQNDYNINPLKGPQSQLVKGSKDWLELGLGFCSSSASTKVLTVNGSTFSSSSSSSPLPLPLALHQSNDQQKPAVGSELGFHHHHDHDHDGMSSPSCTMFTSWPLTLSSSSSPSSCMPLHDSSTNAVGLHYPLIKPQCGLWFMLLSSINRNGEVLPQIPKPHIRVKDEKVTVFMVKTYLVTKLGLSNEAEIEISCMGQKLLHSQTLKNVRDSIWLPTTIFLNPSRSRSTTLILMPSNANSMKYLMPLEYGRKCAF